MPWSQGSLARERGKERENMETFSIKPVHANWLIATLSAAYYLGRYHPKGMEGHRHI